jgi:N-acetylglucosaminyldiphosphoundecaprenol N-acetyl-beta-D-mannosaminyltransferase
MDNLTMQEALSWVMAASAPSPEQTLEHKQGQEPTSKQLAFVNADCLNIAWRDPAYKATLRACDRVFADGIGLRLGGRMLGFELRDNLNGTDLYPLLCEAAAKAGRSLYLLGARPGIAAAAGEAMRSRFPGLLIAGSRDGYFTARDEPAVVEEINRSGAAILLVALGAPRQEQWIARNRDRLAPLVAMGVGGLFDFYSGRIRRAPPWMREIGMEWVYRLLQEPRRMWRRYIIGNPVFLYRVWLQKRRPERFDSPPDDDRRSGAQPSSED